MSKTDDKLSEHCMSLSVGPCIGLSELLLGLSVGQFMGLFEFFVLLWRHLTRLLVKQFMEWSDLFGGLSKGKFWSWELLKGLLIDQFMDLSQHLMGFTVK